MTNPGQTSTNFWAHLPWSRGSPLNRGSSLFLYKPRANRLTLGQNDLLPFQATTRSCFFLAGELRTLGDLLHEFVPEAFTSGSGAIDNEWRVVIHGIEPPLETPAQWISEHFSHPDNFLYIVLVRVV